MARGAVTVYKKRSAVVNIGRFLFPPDLRVCTVTVEYSLERVPRARRRWAVVVNGCLRRLVFVPTHQCPTCRRVFTRRSNLVQHQRGGVCTGSPEAEHVCGVCRTTFTRRSNLVQHARGCRHAR